jgi:hypothetical protein
MVELMCTPTRRVSIVARDGYAWALFGALTLALTNPLVLHLAHAVEDKQDALLNTWIIAWVGHALVTDPLNLFNANIFYPYPNTLAFSETLLPQGLFALPFNLAFDNTILGYNLVLLASFFLAAYAMYLFVFDLTRARGAAVVAATIFAFNPYNLGNLAQVQLLSFGWTPLALLYLRKLLTEDKGLRTKDDLLSRFAIRNSFWFALFFALQALSSFYYAFLAGFAVALYAIWFFITHHASRITFYVSRSTRLAIASMLGALLIVPFFIPYLQVQREMGFERKISESEEFSASLQLYAQVSPQNVVYGNLLAPRPPIVRGGYPLDNLFPGIIALALALVGLLATKDRDKWFYFLLLTFAFLLSMGPRLYLSPTLPTDITLPYRWLYDAFPLMRALRAPVRFDALVMFALAVLAGWGTARLATTDRRPLTATRRFLPTAYCLLLTGLIALEYFAFPAANITPVPVWNEIPEYVRWLRAQPRGVILELPMLASEPGKPLDLTTQYFSTYHWHTTPDGYSGFNPPRRGEIAYEMQAFPNERAFSLIQALDVKYLVLHNTEIENPYGDVEFIARFDHTSIYAVATRQVEKERIGARLYPPPFTAPRANCTVFLILKNTSPRSFAIKPTTRVSVQARWDEATIQQTTATLPLVTSHVTVVPVRLAAPAEVGMHHLNLRVDIPGIATWSFLTAEIEVRSEEPVQSLVLPLGVRAETPFKSEYVAGEHLAIGLRWIPFNKIDAYYSASVRVVDARGNKIVAQDREPAGRTFLWKPNVTVPDHFELTLPPDLAPGEYSIQVKMYQADQGIDALLLDENFTPRETIELTRFTVK